MKILVVVDMQKDFINGSLGTPEAQAIVPKVVDLIKAKADPNTVVIFTKDTHEANYLWTQEGKKLPIKHCIKDTVGHLINEEVSAAFYANAKKYCDASKVSPLSDYEYISIEKPTFGSIDLQNALYTLDDISGIEEITFCGLCTGICVLSNAILAKATLPEVPINVVADCCACVTPASHNTALEAMKLCQINII